MAWHKRKGADLAIRGAGLPLLAIAVLSAQALFGQGARAAVPIDYLIAAVGFANASIGTALVLAGAHLFEPVSVAPRWARIVPKQEGSYRRPG